jgi:Mce-associated membrane protein
VPPSRRQPPTPPSRRPRVAGLRKPSTDESPAERTGQLPAVPPVPPAGARKPRPKPAPRPAPRPAGQPAESFEATSGQLDTASAEDTAVFSAVGTEEEVDALTGKPSTDADPDAEVAPARPAPRRKKRDAGIAKPSDVAEAEAAASVDEEPAPASAGSFSHKPYVLASALVLVALLLGGLAFWFKSEEVKVSDATSNTALLDVAKTAQVKDSVSKAAEALFSYDFNNIKKTEDAANDLLANDDVRNKYNSLMGEVKRLAPAQKMVVTCKVTRAAVIMLNGDLAKVMVFVDQTSTRTDTKKTTAGTAQLHLNAQLQGDKWKITDMDTYNAPKVPAATQAPSPAPASPSPTK